MLLSIITLNYKRHELTVDCMQSLYEVFKHEFEKDAIELIIVDNDSQDGSVAAMKKEVKEKSYKNMHVIANPANSGFGAGCNLGAKSAKGKYLLFLNNDTIAKDHGILAMAKYMDEHPDIAILGGQLRNFDGSLQASTGRFYTLGYAALLLAGGQRYGALDRSPEKGGLMMVRRSEFEALDGFDEKIFMYSEDMEICYRAHLAGKDVYFYPNVMVLHKEHGSTNKTFAIVNIYKSLLYFYKKHRSTTEYKILKSMMVAKAKSLIRLGQVTHKPYLVETYTKALEVVD